MQILCKDGVRLKILIVRKQFRANLFPRFTLRSGANVLKKAGLLASVCMNIQKIICSFFKAFPLSPLKILTLSLQCTA